MEVLEARVASFAKFSLRLTDEEKSKFAKAGFYHDASQGSDFAQCYLCQKGLDGWTKQDDPFQEHKKHSPECALFHLDSEDSRLETFVNWPHKKKGFFATEKRVDVFTEDEQWHFS